MTIPPDSQPVDIGAWRYTLQSLPLTRVVLHCAVSTCKWEHERAQPDLSLVTLRPGSPPGLDFNTALNDAIRRDDDAIRAHLAMHPIEDFLRTIADLRTQLATRDAPTQPAPALA